MFGKIKIHHLPGITCGCFALTFVTTYTIAVLKEHVYPILPFISQTGTMPPESCIFSQMLNIGAVLMALCNYIRYRQIDITIKSQDINLGSNWNTISWWIGNVVAFGISVVGNFQETNVFIVHMLGAFMSFGLAAVYFIIQTRISFSFKEFYQKYPEYGVGNRIIYYRLVLTVLYIAFFLLIFIFAPLGFKQFKGTRVTWWTEEDGGYEYHVIATFSEWCLFIVMALYVFTGTYEFKFLEFQSIEFKSKIFGNV